jgi:hypothetical protein
MELSENAKALETAGQRGDRDYIRKYNGNFLSDLEALLNRIDEVISIQKSRIENVSLDMDLLKDKLLKLKVAMIDFDTATINQEAKGLQEFTQASDVGDIVDKILKFKLLGEYDKAELLIDEILIK